MQRKISVPAVLILLIVGGAYYYSSRKSKPLLEVTDLTSETQLVIQMGEDSYQPTDIRIKKGTKVIFVNNTGSLRWPASDLHPGHGIHPDFDSKEPVEQGDSWEFIFDEAGEWGFHDHLAPYITGIIEVID